jgi:peptide subunit release factor RF-3
VVTKEAGAVKTIKSRKVQSDFTWKLNAKRISVVPSVLAFLYKDKKN